MAGRNIVFFGDPTTLVTGTYESDPFDVTAYKTVTVQTQCRAAINSALISVQVQESSNLVKWTNVGDAMDPNAPDVESVTLTGTARYVRAVATVSGSNATAVLWVKGIARDC
jgi:hypothetical protein